MAQFDFSTYYRGLDSVRGNRAFNAWRDEVPGRLCNLFARASHGRLPEWRRVFGLLPDWSPDRVELADPVVTVGSEPPPGREALQVAEQQLRSLMPWRKGPYNIHGISIDSEWRSDLKWERVADAIAPLAGRLVLDVGCGNGYHCWRMRGAGARAVIGVDPTLPYVMQYLAVQHFLRSSEVFVLPWALEALPPALNAFDTVFSMGVLYHSRAPFEHLRDLYGCLRPGGELVLETLIVEGDEQRALIPRGRYARMKNVWLIPSVAMLEVSLARCGFTDIRCIDNTATTADEQRVTDWSGGASLVDFLAPDDPEKTIEGYPAPRRAILIARR